MFVLPSRIMVAVLVTQEKQGKSKQKVSLMVNQPRGFSAYAAVIVTKLLFRCKNA